MFRNFLLMATRNLAKQRLFAGFNILGIAMGIACCIVVYLLIQFHYNQDTFHSKASVIYMVNHVRTTDGSPEQWATSPDPIGPALKADLPDVKRFVRFQGERAVVKSGSNVFNEYIRLADPDFFRMFSFSLQAGSPDALTDPSAIILSEPMARKYFGNAQAIGQQLTILFGDKTKRNFTVRAVAAPFPNTASFSFDMLVNFAVGKELGWKDNDWARQVQATFIELTSPSSADKVTKALNRYVKAHNAINQQLVISSFYLDNLLTTAQHSHNTRHALASGTSPTGLLVLGVLAGLVLLMACFNFMNYTIATSTSRFKEIGVRKVLGSTRKQLIQQFIGENLLSGFLALVLAIVLAETLFLPAFSQLIDFYQLRFNLIDNWKLVLFLLVLMIGIGLISGLYPSLYISSFSPINVLKGKQRIAGNNGFVRTLLVVQFGLSMFTVAAAIVTTQNAQFIRHMDVGYNQNQLVVLRTDSEKSFNYLRDVASRLPDVVQVAGSQDQIGRAGDQTITLETSSVKSTADVFRVGSDYVSALGLRLTQGRNFLPDSPVDADQSVLVNESLVKTMGWQSAVGKRIRLDNKSYQVAGVVHDFNYQFFFVKIAPCILKLNRSSENRVLTLKVNTADLATLSNRLKTEWYKVMPDVPFELSQQEDVYSASYDESRRVKDVFTYVAILTLIISIMGLFALVSLSIAKKTKEIGIRKVLGASAFSVANLLNREFLILISVAGIIFLPLAFVAMKALFDNVYVYHIPVTAGSFVGALLLILLLALITIGSQVYKVAISNPVKALQTE
ncbi:ABC transporter permease [Spirosoma sp. KNUC1025]|uniref:ABC transporter permease n=1 Tax=Spirosoma sp. KNUC1025 TaxID=2894082 RepID=UPI003870AF7B|nr:ABC transporter permease [Spirosoma sp. KNUC1025]